MNVRISTNLSFSLFLCTLVLFASTSVFGSSYDVPGDYASIQLAINGVSEGDTILVQPGTYLENLTIDNKSVTLKSTGGASQTIIDGRGRSNTINALNAPNLWIEGFTIKNGQATDGACIKIKVDGSNGNYTISNNTILGGVATYCGGIALVADNLGNIIASIISNTIQNNFAKFGGGLGANAENSSKITISSNNNNINNNEADRYNYSTRGGGIYLNPAGSGSSIIFRSLQDTISQNNAGGSGAGLAGYSTSAGELAVDIDQATILGNKGGSSGSGVVGGGVSIDGSNTIKNILFTNSNISSNSLGGISISGSGELKLNLTKNIISTNMNMNGGVSGCYISTDNISNITIANNTIKGNYTLAGAGRIGIAIYNNSTLSLEILNNNILSNKEQFGAGNPGNGYGIYLSNSSSLTASINNNLIADNGPGGTLRSYGLGLYLVNTAGKSAVKLFNNTIANNKNGLSGLHFYKSGGICNVSILNNIIYGNDGNDLYNDLNSASIITSYSDIGTSFGYYDEGPGNISKDPLFINSLAKDYHLSDTSPCIDHGTFVGAPKYDLEGNPRRGKGYDMGSFEFQSGPVFTAGGGMPWIHLLLN